MKHLHEEMKNEKVIRRWVNEIEDSADELYYLPTFKIHKIGTDEYYDLADDLTNEKREQNGLEAYQYEVSDIEIDADSIDLYKESIQKYGTI